MASAEDTMRVNQTAAKEKFSRVLNLEQCKQPNGDVIMRLPGFSFDDFNRAGQLNIVQLDRLKQLTRSEELAHSSTLLYTLGTQWLCSRRLYQRAAVRFPMRLRMSTTGVGASSVDNIVTLVEDDQSPDGLEPLASCITRRVNVDPINHRPTPFPASVADAFSANVVAGGAKFPVVQLPARVPEVNFSCRLRVLHDDMDFLFHTNVSAYAKYAMECAGRAAAARFYSVLKGDLAFRCIRTITSLFLGESVAGDELDVSTWEDGRDPLVVHFAISRQSKPIYFATVEYHADGNCPDVRSQL